MSKAIRDPAIVIVASALCMVAAVPLCAQHVDGRQIAEDEGEK